MGGRGVNLGHGMMLLLLAASEEGRRQGEGELERPHEDALVPLLQRADRSTRLAREQCLADFEHYPYDEEGRAEREDCSCGELDDGDDDEVQDSSGVCGNTDLAFPLDRRDA